MWSWKSEGQVSQGGMRDAALLQISLRGVEVQVTVAYAGRVCVYVCVHVCGCVQVKNSEIRSWLKERGEIL